MVVHLIHILRGSKGVIPESEQCENNTTFHILEKSWATNNGVAQLQQNSCTATNELHWQTGCCVVSNERLYLCLVLCCCCCSWLVWLSECSRLRLSAPHDLLEKKGKEEENECEENLFRQHFLSSFLSFLPRMFWEDDTNATPAYALFFVDSFCSFPQKKLISGGVVAGCLLFMLSCLLSVQFISSCIVNTTHFCWSFLGNIFGACWVYSFKRIQFLHHFTMFDAQ